jgi:hypothetical protein
LRSFCVTTSDGFGGVQGLPARRHTKDKNSADTGHGPEHSFNPTRDVFGERKKMCEPKILLMDDTANNIHVGLGFEDR